MKRNFIIALSLILLTFTNVSFAQESHKNNIQLGVKIAPGIDWLKVSSQGYNSDGSNIRFAWGLISDFQFIDKYYISTGFNILSLGGKMKYNDIVKFANDTVLHLGEYKRSYSIRYIEIPVSIKMKTNRFGKLTYFGQLGLGLGMRLSAHSDDDFYVSGNSVALSMKDNKIEDQINFMRLSMIISAGVEYNLGSSTSLFGAISFNNGFTNIFDFKSNIPASQSADAANNALELSIGLLF